VSSGFFKYFFKTGKGRLDARRLEHRVPRKGVRPRDFKRSVPIQSIFDPEKKGSRKKERERRFGGITGSRWTFLRGPGGVFWTDETFPAPGFGGFEPADAASSHGGEQESRRSSNFSKIFQSPFFLSGDTSPVTNIRPTSL